MTIKKDIKLSFLCFILIVTNVLLRSTESFGQVKKTNKEIVLTYFEEVVNGRKVELLEEIFSKNYISHGLIDESKSEGLDKLKDFLPYFFKAFPDGHYKIEDVISEGDKVVIRVIFSGTQKDEFLGIEASNQKIDYLSEIFFFRLKDGKIQEGWVQIDLYNLINKLKSDQ